MRSKSRLLALILAAGLAVVGGAPVGAQTGGPVASGEFTGTIEIYGGFTYDSEDGFTTLIVRGEGPLQITLTDGTMTGTWNLAGTTSLFGSFGGGGKGAVAIGGKGTFTGSGPFEGPPGQYRMSGPLTSTNTVTVTAAGGVVSQTASDTSTDMLNEALTDMIVLCDTIVGRWDLRLRQQIEAVGFDEFIRGYFSATTGIDATEQAERVEDLLSRIAEWVGGENDVLENTTSLYIGSGISLLDSVQRLQAELAAPTPCPPDPQFATQLTLGVQDVIASLIARLPGITTSSLVALGFGSGAIGSGSPAPDRAGELAELLTADVQAKWDDLVADEGSSLADLLDTARAAQMLGITELGDGGLSPSDVILVFGDSP